MEIQILQIIPGGSSWAVSKVMDEDIGQEVFIAEKVHAFALVEEPGMYWDSKPLRYTKGLVDVGGYLDLIEDKWIVGYFHGETEKEVLEKVQQVGLS